MLCSLPFFSKIFLFTAVLNIAHKNPLGIKFFRKIFANVKIFGENEPQAGFVCVRVLSVVLVLTNSTFRIAS